MFQQVNASELNLGQCAVVSAVLDDSLAAILSERGLLVGDVFKVERIAGFGGPIAFRLDDHLVCLRRSEASQIEVNPLAE